MRSVKTSKKGLGFLDDCFDGIFPSPQKLIEIVLHSTYAVIIWPTSKYVYFVIFEW